MDDSLEYLDGPGFVEWVMRRRPDLDGKLRVILGDSQARNFGRWRHGDKVSLQQADRLCCDLYLHINEIPDELWVEAPARGGTRKAASC